jgi:hypothetical protein
MARKKEKQKLDEARQKKQRENFDKIVADLYNMPPQKAVAILQMKEPLEILEILNAHENWCERNEKTSLRAYYLQLLPAEKAEKVIALQKVQPLAAPEQL